MSKKLKILFVSTEVAPHTKAGGLGEVMRSLPKALRSLGHDARVFVPKYGKIASGEAIKLKPAINLLKVPIGGEQNENLSCKVEVLKSNNQTPIYFLGNKEYYELRANAYGYSDDATRFALLSRAALEFIKNQKWIPDVINFTDWHTGFGPNYMATEYKDDAKLAKIATVFSIHNLYHQGGFDHACVSDLDFDDGKSPLPSLFDIRLGKLNGMRRGIMYADAVNTVSEKYAQEILTDEYGEGLSQLLNETRGKLFGILNGIDIETHNPKTDENIPFRFCGKDIEKRINNKKALQREFNLPISEDIPLVGMVTRVVGQKGMDLIEQILEPAIENLGIQFVIAGSADKQYREVFEKFKEKNPEKVATHLVFDNKLPRLIFAGADIFLMPSRFEPCGITQMEAMRYGSIPIVRATGGLADTVINFDLAKNSGYGFIFEKYEPLQLYTQIVRAVETYKNKKVWSGLIRKVMKLDFSWKTSAKKYIELYDSAIEAHNSLSSR
jgi:starch synthase